MKAIIILLSLLGTAPLCQAQRVNLTGTNKPQLDGEYRLAGTRNGRNAYTRTVDHTTYSIYCRRQGEASVWMIEDDQGNSYFGASAATREPPVGGWDVGRAGKGLNPNFSLQVEPSPVAAPLPKPGTVRIRLANNRNATQRVIVRTGLNGQETVRARTYQPTEVYDYALLPGTQLYLLTEDEGQQLMSGRGKSVTGRLLLTVRPEDEGKTYPIDQH